MRGSAIRQRWVCPIPVALGRLRAAGLTAHYVAMRKRARRRLWRPAGANAIVRRAPGRDDRRDSDVARGIAPCDGSWMSKAIAPTMRGGPVVVRQSAHCREVADAIAMLVPQAEHDWPPRSPPARGPRRAADHARSGSAGVDVVMTALVLASSRRSVSARAVIGPIGLRRGVCALVADEQVRRYARLGNPHLCQLGHRGASTASWLRVCELGSGGPPAAALLLCCLHDSTPGQRRADRGPPGVLADLLQTGGSKQERSD